MLDHFDEKYIFAILWILLVMRIAFPCHDVIMNLDNGFVLIVHQAVM